MPSCQGMTGSVKEMTEIRVRSISRQIVSGSKAMPIPAATILLIRSHCELSYTTLG
ncbi:hypothetical protein D3C73_1505170 [compost metagenome]